LTTRRGNCSAEVMTWRALAGAVDAPGPDGLPWAWAMGAAASKLKAKHRVVMRNLDMGVF
jgi:hypothetical protein